MLEATQKQKAVEVLTKSQRITLLTHKDPDGDALGSLLALFLVLQKLKKEVRAVYLGTPDPGFDFLPAYQKLHRSLKEEEVVFTLEGLADSEATLMFRKDLEKGALQIKISFAEKTIESDKIKVEKMMFKPEVLVTLDVSDLNQLEPEFGEAKEALEKAIIINIDHHKSNTQFGDINLLDSNATATAEVLVSFLEALSSSLKNDEQVKNNPVPKTLSLFDADIATCLLCGILTDTSMFQNNNTTPKSLTVAAQLLGLGARREEIVRHLKTQSLSQLRVKARVLERIKTQKGFIYSYLLQKDFEELQASEVDASGIIDKELKTVAGVKVALLLVETKEGIRGRLRSIDDRIDVAKIAQVFGGGGHRGAAGFLVSKEGSLENIEEIAQKIFEAINLEQDELK